MSVLSAVREKRRVNAFFPAQSGLFIFNETSLMAVAAIVSLCLQIISFLTTLEGSRIYFEETFVYAPLLFSVAVQSVVYFLDNSIRRRVTLGKAMALTLAMCCSTYFSYIGIYNNVNSPLDYLESRYRSVSAQLTESYESYAVKEEGGANDVINKAVNGISARYSLLSSRRTALAEIKTRVESVSVSAAYGISAPARYNYYDYEDYAAAYSEYIAAYSGGAAAEAASAKAAILSGYGYSDIAALESEISENTALLSMYEGGIGGIASALSLDREQSAVTPCLESIRESLTGLIDSGDTGATASSAVSQLIQLYNTSEEDKLDGEAVMKSARLNANVSPQLMKSYEELSVGLTGEPMELRRVMEREISAACDEIGRIAAISGGNAPYSQEGYEITDVYMIPVMNLTNPATRPMALLCLAIAGAVDLLSLLFAMIFVKRRNVLSTGSIASAVSRDSGLFERNVISAVCGGEQGEASLNTVIRRIGEYIALFRPTDIGSRQGYSLIAPAEALSDFPALTAFLCQFNMAKLIGESDYRLISGEETTGGRVLLKTRFLLWYSEKWSGAIELTSEDSGEEKRV